MQGGAPRPDREAQQPARNRIRPGTLEQAGVEQAGRGPSLDRGALNWPSVAVQPLILTKATADVRKCVLRAGWKVPTKGWDTIRPFSRRTGRR